jgi:predicted  nucleic acid-binding Zn-ribbon protein
MAMDSLADRAAQLVDELAHADRLIDRLVADNERLRAQVAHQERIIAAFRSRAAQGQTLTIVDNGRADGRDNAEAVMRR